MLRPIRFAVACVLAGLFVGSAAQAGPITGYYESELSGDVLEGLWSESYLSTNPSPGPGQVGNTVHAASNDGATLATQWELLDAAIDAPPTLLADFVDGNGDGFRIWLTTYSGGRLVLANSAVAPWYNSADLDSEYTVTLTNYTHNTQVTYVGGNPVEVSTTVQTSGTFDAPYSAWSVSFVVAQAYQVGEGTPLPAGYPAFLPTGETTGGWGIAQKIRTEIVPEPATMALLGVGLGVLALRRRCRKAR